MEFYIMLFIITLIIAFLDFTNIKRKYKIYMLVGIGIVYIFISGFRWNNTDWNIYYPFFMENNSLDDFWYGYIPIDKGFGLINFVVKSIIDNYTALLCTLAVVILGIKINFIATFATFPLLSLFYWFSTYLSDIYFVRQALAVSITLISFRFIVKKQLMYFLICVFIAATIQVSTIVFVLAYFIYHRNIKIKYLVLGIVLSIMIGRYLDSSLLVYFGQWVDILPDSDRLANKVVAYTEGTEANSEAGWLFLGFVRRLFFIPIELMCMYKLKNYISTYRGCLNLIIFGYMLYFLFANISATIAIRISTAFYIYEIITIPAMFLLVKSLKIKLILFIIFIGYCGMKYIYLINNFYDVYIPYINVLFNQI